MQVALESLQCKVKTYPMTKAGSLTFKFYILLVDYGGNQWCNLSGCQKSCMRSHNKLVSVRVVGPPTKSYQVCPFLATISQDKSRKKRGWIKKYGWGAKKSANQRSAGKLRLNTRFEHHFSLISIMIMIISPWSDKRTKWWGEKVHWERSLRNNSLVINGHLQYHGIVNTCCVSRVYDHIMSRDGAGVYWRRKTPTDRFLEITSWFFDMDLWRRRWREEVDSYHFHIFWTARY